MGIKRKYAAAALTSLVIVIVLIAISYMVVSMNARRRTFNDVSDISHNNVGSLLATSPITPGAIDASALFNQEAIIEDYSNSVKGHIEKDTIVGNFIGNRIDTLYVSIKFDEKAEIEDRVKYYAKSNNPLLPTIELYGCLGSQPQLVYEGDVDGDGKDEWGYLHTWTMSQWRQYRIYNYDNSRKEWRFLYYDVGGDKELLLNTLEYVRSRGVDIVEKGPMPGTIRINYGSGYPKFELRDTIVKPTYTRISNDA